MEKIQRWRKRWRKMRWTHKEKVLKKVMDVKKKRPRKKEMKKKEG